jgi:hypothetical protein
MMFSKWRRIITRAVWTGSSSVQNLDDYEPDLVFTPEWVNIAFAIEANKSVLASDGVKPLWAERETFVLELLKA